MNRQSTLSRFAGPLVVAAAFVGCQRENGHENADAPASVTQLQAQQHGEVQNVVDGPSRKEQLKEQLRKELLNFHEDVRSKYMAPPHSMTREQLDLEESCLWNSSTADLQHSSLRYDCLTPFQTELVDLYAKWADGWRRSGFSTEGYFDYFVAEDIKGAWQKEQAGK